MEKNIIKILVILILIFFSNITVLAVDKNVTIVSPLANSVVEEGNILLSIKVTEPKNIRIKMTEIKKTTAVKDTYANLNEADMKKIIESKYENIDKLVYFPLIQEEFASKNKLSFYTKKLENFKQGVYVIEIETIENNKVVNVTKSYVTSVPKANQEKIFDNTSKGAPTFLHNLLKSVFGG